MYQLKRCIIPGKYECVIKWIAVKQTDVLQHTLKKLTNYTEKKHLVAGFDGFVDEIIHVVDKRNSPDEYKRIKKITDFSERIASVAGLSANIELVPIQTKLGGNGPIMANAIMEQGHDVSYIGALGEHQIDPVFHDMSTHCRQVISLTDPGHTDALEFYDGKIMLGKMNRLTEVNLENLYKQLPEEKLKELLADTDLVAFTNWTMLSNLNEIIEAFGNIIGKLQDKPRVFIDLADPQKRNEEDIRAVLDLLSGMPCDTILSMNQNESRIINTVLGNQEEEDLRARAARIREQMGIKGIVIHPVHGAAIDHDDESVWIDGPYTKRPKLTTGAGDNFNAGFCNAWLGGFSPGECLMLGVCTSGYYVRNAKSPTRDELLPFMQQWLDVECGSLP